MVAAAVAAYGSWWYYSTHFAFRFVSGMSGEIETPSEPRMLEVSYRDMLNTALYTHSGTTVGKALQDPDRYRAQLQPFVAPMSYLLPNVIDAELGLPKTPQQNVLSAYPPGSEQPAWAAILREGRIQVTTDYAGHARVYLQTDDPSNVAAAYTQAYPIFRHCLEEIAPDGGQRLEVEVFAFQNDYGTSTIRLNAEPARVSANRFGPPAGKHPLNLEALDRFFTQKPVLQGGQYKDGTFTLLGAQGTGSGETIDGSPLSTSDLAVAYRACFHAGDNEAYISLDPNPDPTIVNVNFGGLLEDTRVGAVVLAADKRFKTMTSGLDPDTFVDVRPTVRKVVPGFLTSAERMYLTDEKVGDKWIGTRYWFYPDSIQVDTTADGNLAVISNPLFKADAERSKDDFADLAEFEAKKASTLSPSTRQSIDDINERYAEYSRVFPELAELRGVGRLFGLCRWLKERPDPSVDLDSLLAVRLPAKHTPRSKAQMIDLTRFSGGPTKANLIQNSVAAYLGYGLNEPIREVFGSKSNFRKFVLGSNAEDRQTLLRLYDTSYAPVRAVIRTEADLRRLADVLVERAEIYTKGESTALHAVDKLEAIDLSKADLKTLDRMLNELKSAEKSFESSGGFKGIGGGIDLGIGRVKVVEGSSNTTLTQLSAEEGSISTAWTPIGGAGRWMRSANAIDEASTSVAARRGSGRKWRTELTTSEGKSTRFSLGEGENALHLTRSVEESGAWTETTSREGMNVAQRTFRGEDLAGFEAAANGHPFAYRATKSGTTFSFKNDVSLAIANSVPLDRSHGIAVSVVKLPDRTYLVAGVEGSEPRKVDGIVEAISAAQELVAKVPNATEPVPFRMRGFPDGEDAAFVNSLELRLKREGLSRRVVGYSVEGELGDEVLAARQVKSNVVSVPEGTKLVGGRHMAEFRVEGTAVGIKGTIHRFVLRIKVFFSGAMSSRAMQALTNRIAAAFGDVGPERTFAQALAGLKKDLQSLPYPVEVQVHASEEGWDMTVVKNGQRRRFGGRTDRSV
ncbi:MAG: hypothetical protein EOP84_02330 [Verrucomicrobiaceae bacterium]|nr:MAG: hypothetical protein EOP84_02330 [Verrucomicrobiaceae bacterium]